MPRGRSARDLARSTLRRVEQEGAFATPALASALDTSDLAAEDRALATELVYGVLRHRARLDRALTAQAPRGLVRLPVPVLVALRVAAYQVLFLRVPAHAAVDDAVGAIKVIAGAKMAGFANAVLRRLAASGEQPMPPASDALSVLEAVHSIPRWIGERLVARLGPEEAVVAAAAMNRPAPVAVRVSINRVDRETLAARVLAERPRAEAVASSYLPEALLLSGAGSPEALAPFREGLCTVQDVAAQLVGRLCGARPGEVILDACAGVGGKSTHLAELARGAGGAALIDAVDLSRRKLELAQDAARRMGVEIRTRVADLTSAGDEQLAPAYDRVLLDAPCSGLGVLRRHPEGKWRRRADEIATLATLQARMLANLAPRVRPGGVLVYSVCTFTAEEGPGQVHAFLAAHPGFVLAPPPRAQGVDFAPFLDDKGQFASWPHRHDADGFFAARLVRRA